MFRTYLSEYMLPLPPLGRGAKATGRPTNRGGYVIMKNKIPEIVVPDLEGFQVRCRRGMNNCTIRGTAAFNPIHPIRNSLKCLVLNLPYKIP